MSVHAEIDAALALSMVGVLFERTREAERLGGQSRSRDERSDAARRAAQPRAEGSGDAPEPAPRRSAMNAFQRLRREVASS